MPTPVGYAILAGLAFLLLVTGFSVVDRPRRALVIVDLLAVGLFAWLALSSHRTAQFYERILAAHREYPVETSPGIHTIRIDELPDVRGVRVVAHPKDRTTTIPWDIMKACDWRADGTPVEMKDWGIDVVLVDEDMDDWGQGRFKKMELSYQVTTRTQATLDRIVIVASAPRWEYMAADMLGAIEGILRIVFAIGALVSLAGFLSQFIRGRRRKAA